MNKKPLLLAFAFLLIIPVMLYKSHLRASLPGAEEIVKKAVRMAYGEKSMQAQLSLHVFKEDKQEAEIDLKIWQNYPDEFLLLVTAPARYRGNALLRKKKEVWSWQPDSEKLTKLSPMEIAEVWMDTNISIANLTNYLSFEGDVAASFKNLVRWNGTDCYVIEITQNSEAMQTRNNAMLWIDSKNYSIQKSEFYDEDEYLVATCQTLRTETLKDHTYPVVSEWKTAGQPADKTTVMYKSVVFDQTLPARFFSVENMKTIR
ncbi:MAG: outer membrane lipoprotein-sorting protein [Sphingobacteriales bacterium]|nr:MAG: outer membrane lipoprotein-sorting protein [Sphingobacteriales bacterium]